MKSRFALAVALGFSAFAGARAAHAEPLDPALERLVSAETAGCRSEAGAYTPVGGVTGGRTQPCLPDDIAFKKLINQFGFALAPSAMHSARTTGFGGFNLSVEAVYTGINGGKDYWKRGTQGPRDPNTNQPSIINDSPPGLLQDYSLKFRKGFGFGLELTGVVGFMPQ